MKWVNVTDRLPTKPHNYHVKMRTSKSFTLVNYLFNTTCLFRDGVFIDDINITQLAHGHIVEKWLDESEDQETSALRAENERLTAENAALRQQVKDMGEVIKELRTSFILDSIDVRFDGITVKGEDRILSLTLSRKS